MTFPLPPDLPLADSMLSSETPVPTLQLSPTTFKSVISSFIDLLIEHQISALVWAKLPRREAWQVELRRYCLADNLAKTVYLFGNQLEEIPDEAVGINLGSEMDSEAIDESAALPMAQILPIQLTADSALRREYFLLVWSTQFQGGVVAHRSRSVPAKEAVLPSETDADEGLEKKQLLLTTCLFEQQQVRQALSGIEQALPQTVAELQSPLNSEQPAPVDCVAHWQEQVATLPATGPDLPQLAFLWMKQLQKQEEIWQRSTAYRKQAELAEALQLQNAELTTALRLRDDFLNTVGQELRTPLTTIKTALTLLNSPSLKGPQRQRYMELIAKECDRQSSLITSLLNLVQLDQSLSKTAIEALRVFDVIPGVVSTYQPLAEEKGVRLAYTVPEELPAVSCASSWLKQIVINLLHNGIKFTDRGGQVWVRAKRQGDAIQLEFRDTGVGIPAAEIPKIFDRFYRIRQLSEVSDGAGLGLSIVQQLLSRCGGSISVKSRVGEGSTFTVLLPIHQQALQE